MDPSLQSNKRVNSENAFEGHVFKTHGEKEGETSNEWGEATFVQHERLVFSRAASVYPYCILIIQRGNKKWHRPQVESWSGRLLYNTQSTGKRIQS